MTTSCSASSHLHEEDPRNFTFVSTCCSAPRTSSGWVTTPPTLPKTVHYLIEARTIAEKRPKGDDTTAFQALRAAADR